MPELRIVVLALQDRLAYGPTFEAALAALFGQAPSTLAAAPHSASAPAAPRRAVNTCGRTCRNGRDARASRRRQRADPGRGARSRRLPAAHGRRKARGSGPEARSTEAEARAAELDATLNMATTEDTEDTEDEHRAIDMPLCPQRPPWSSCYCSTRSANVITYPSGILDRELAHAVELRHDRHHDLHRRLQPIVQRVDPFDFDEERAGGADRLAAEGRDTPSPPSRRR